jgi:rod shape-determining protein MreC
MSHLRFNQVFLALLLVSAVCAFVVPERYCDGLRRRMRGVFTPVAYPLSLAAQRLVGRSEGTGPVDLRAVSADARGEIERLQTQVANLTRQLEQFRQVYRERDALGDVQKYSLRFNVVGVSSDSRQGLMLAGGTGDGLSSGMAVIGDKGVVGRISSVGPGGSQVRLITDSGFLVGGAFGRFNGTEFVSLATEAPMVEGRGNGTMAITNLALKQVAGVQAGDWVVLRDEEDGWPRLIQGMCLGRVEKISPQKKSPLHAEILVRPRLNLTQFREVWVISGKQMQSAK